MYILLLYKQMKRQWVEFASEALFNSLYYSCFTVFRRLTLENVQIFWNWRACLWLTQKNHVLLQVCLFYIQVSVTAIMYQIMQLSKKQGFVWTLQYMIHTYIMFLKALIDLSRTFGSREGDRHLFNNDYDMNSGMKDCINASIWREGSSNFWP